MSNTSDSTQRDLLAHVLVPVAHEDDALKTARALEPYDPNRVTALHVVEKGEGVPDKTPVEQSEELAAESYAAVRQVFPDADDHTAYARDVVGAIFEAADDVNASAIAYRARGGNRIMQFLSGDLSLKLITRGNRPVIALPRTETNK
ncbi:UspA domain protein (plasmid) [Haloterrigena turkmenica DSM 5511]|uniref:UspA domain protein n=1 Tax=Haloterrigena turkmenica (strain ATCC 51198 / DSM 5511 / JCM 9101 / NCIMB 13204 / VKM B-1734 / 4k) TaxID=543526 RepID=D2S3C3_HALTV|nr:universal stress protein [Haloterrigena turkmenica]ADB63870.1 UspA domain protein [Haloterrigena turkmenica DSM 5511]